MAITTELVGLFVLLIGAIGGLWWKIEAKIASESANSRRTQVELYDFKLYVAQNYVSSLALRETEQRLITAMEKLAVRMEAVVSRLDKISLKQNQDSP
jgi:hypothetical protein